MAIKGLSDLDFNTHSSQNTMNTEKKLQNVIDYIELWRATMQNADKDKYKKGYIAGYLDALDEVLEKTQCLIDMGTKNQS